MVIDKKYQKFLKDCDIFEEEINSLGYNIDELFLIYKDFKAKAGEYKELGGYIVQNLLQKSDLFHSIKFRVKRPESLIKKIVRKSKKGLSLENYTSKIDDLVGIRVFLLNKDDWKEIHDFVTSKRDLKEKVAYYNNKNEKASFFKDFQPEEIKESYIGYSSLHYIIQTNPTKQNFSVEIQVRSLLEEVRSEVDHLLRYKKTINVGEKPTISSGLRILNALVIKGNELVSFLCRINKDKIYMKDLSSISRMIRESSLNDEQKNSLYQKINPFNNIGLDLPKDLSETLFGLVDKDKPLADELILAIENFIKNQQEIKEKFDIISKGFVLDNQENK